MKKWIWLLFFIVQTLHAQGKWSNPIVLLNGIAPDLDFDRSTNQLHIVSRTSSVAYTRTDSLGNILEQGVVPGSESSDYSGWYSGPGIAVDKSGDPHIGFSTPANSFPNVNAYYISKTGLVWGSRLGLAANVYRGYMIQLATDKANRVHVVRTYGTSNVTGGISYQQIVNGREDQTKRKDWTQDYNGELRLDIQTANPELLHILAGCPQTPNGSIIYYLSEDKGNSINSLGDIHSGQCAGKNGSSDLFADQAGNVHMCYGTQKDESVANNPSIRYVRYNKKKELVNDIAVTKAGNLAQWAAGQGWGICSIASTDSGNAVMIAYITKDVGDLYTVLSPDGGNTWNAPVKVAGAVDARPNGRTRPILRAYRNHFYLLYAQTSDTTKEDSRKCQVVLNYFRNYGDLPPTAEANGPYSGPEGVYILLDGSVSKDNGAYPRIVEYAWDTNNDGKYEVVTGSSRITYAFPDNYKGKIVLRVKDWIGQTDTSQTSANITNVSPKAEAGTDRTCYEGDLLQFAGSGTDVPVDVLTYSWSFGDGSTATGQKVSHSYKDEGTYKLILQVSDDDGGVSKDSLMVSAWNANPVVDAGGPYVVPISETALFNGSATDSGVMDLLTYKWDLDGDGTFKYSGKQVSKKYTALGKYMVWLMVTDEDGGIGVDTASIFIVRDNPVIQTIPNQSIKEGKSFSPVLLDNYVADPFFKNSELIWSYRGNQRLIVSLKNHILTAAVPDSEWSGSETLTLIVKNPKNIKDSSDVMFTVQAVNDPPRWIKPVSNYAFDQDSSLAVPLDSLRNRVTDIDNSIGQLSFSLTGTRFVRWKTDPVRNVLILSAAPRWHGLEDVFFVVTDAGGLSATSKSQINVRLVPQPPAPFSLISPMYLSKASWPDTIRCRWQRTMDNDTTGGTVFYEWILADQNSLQTPLLKKFVIDTTYLLSPVKGWQNGTYFWWVMGYTSHGFSIHSSNIGILIVGKTDVADNSEKMPTEFQLLQNYPNPFNPETRVTYKLPRAGRIRLAVINTLGQEVVILDDGAREAGIHTVVWDGKDQSGRKLPSGLYLCRFQAEDAVYYRKMMIMQ